MFKIGDFARIARVTVRTLRYYEERGLLHPAQIDTFTGYRYYTPEQLPRLNRILALKDLDLSLEQIARLLDEDLSAAELQGMLWLKQAELEEQISAGQERLARVAARLNQIKQEGKMPDYEVVLKNVEPVMVAEVQEVIPTFDQVGETFDRIFDEVCAYIVQHGAQFAGPGIALWYSESEDMTDMEVGAAMPFKGKLVPSARIRVYSLPGCLMASVVHHGSFDGFQQPYQAVLSWIRENGYRHTGPSREVYLQYERKGDPANYVTEIQFPVEKA